jgi:hypothetical protein
MHGVLGMRERKKNVVLYFCLPLDFCSDYMVVGSPNFCSGVVFKGRTLLLKPRKHSFETQIDK